MILNQKYTIVQNNHRKISMLSIVLLVCLVVTACSNSQTPQAQNGDGKKEWTTVPVEFPFQDMLSSGEYHYTDSDIYNDCLDVFLTLDSNSQIHWYCYDMLSERWIKKDFVWNSYQNGNKYSYSGWPEYDSKGNRYALWRDNGTGENGDNIYQMKEDGSLECYVRLSDYIDDYEDISSGWRFLEDDKIIISVKHQSVSKPEENVIIDPINKKMTKTFMENLFIMANNVVFAGDNYVYPNEYDNHKLCIKVGDMWDFNKKKFIRSDVKLDMRDSVTLFPLMKEDKYIYLFSQYGVYSCTLEDESMKCVVPENAVNKELSQYSVFTEGYKVKGEDKYFVLGQKGSEIGLYKIS